MVNAQLRYYLHIPDPDALTDEDWAMRLKELQWVRTEEKKGNGPNNPRLRLSN